MNLGIETETLEFKKSTGELKEAMHSICAILNKHQHLQSGREGNRWENLVSNKTMDDADEELLKNIWFMHMMQGELQFLIRIRIQF
ncbi:MAG: hypothetical protein V8S08_08620 [Lachnoclostridium sp.]